MEKHDHHKTTDVTRLLADLYEVEAVVVGDKSLTYHLTPRYASTRSRALIEDRLRLAGYRFKIRESNEGLLLLIDPQRRISVPRLNIVLFIVTILSVYLVPTLFNTYLTAIDTVGKQWTQEVSGFWNYLVFFQQVSGEALRQLGDELADGTGIEFTLALISILLIHEMGHFVASRRRGIITSWPYFIPAPNIIGTFGAVIKSKSPFWNRRDLIEVGAAGPIAGWIVAVGWFVYGLTSATPQPIESLPAMDFTVGQSLMTWLSVHAVVGPLPDGYTIPLTEAAFAGWVGFLVTAINLLPIGQLDGGHILYGLFRRHQFWLARAAMVALILLGFQAMMWWIFAAFGLILGVKHPPTLNDDRPPGRVATVMGWVSLAILILSFIPIPFAM